MSVIPQGKAIQAMYRDYVEGRFLVNRKYQRKLVWTIDEKRSLIDSVLKGYPIPLILLAERTRVGGSSQYEIIDGIQRLNAVFSFVEQAYDIDGRYFDINQFATAKDYASKGAFIPNPTASLLDAELCARFLDYQLAVTVYPPANEAEVTDVFGRVNSGGRQLSAQEQRQAGVTSQFSSLVRSIAEEIRGDVSQDILSLEQMPEISVETDRHPHGYGIRAEDTLWCRQGILSVKQLQRSEDEQLLADVLASVVLGNPIAVSREYLDTIYDPNSADGLELERKLIAYGTTRIATEIKSTFSVLIDIVESQADGRNFLRSLVRPGSGGRYPIKAPFYAIYMAFFELLVHEEKSPVDYGGILGSLRGLASRIQSGAHYETTENRRHNVAVARGLIQDFFAAQVPPAFGHGPSLLIDFQNALRRSKIESARYEYKQGILSLDGDRRENEGFKNHLVNTACAIANLGPEADGTILIGVADNSAAADRVKELDGVGPLQLEGKFIVGIDREARILDLSIDRYVQRIVSWFQESELSEPLRTHVLSGFDTLALRGMTVIRIVVPRQDQLSFVGNSAYLRHDNSTLEVTGQQLVAAYKRFT